MSWKEVRATIPDQLDWSPFVELFRRHGIENTLEEGDFLVGCFPKVEGVDLAIAALDADLRTAGALEIGVQDLPEVNWEIAWRQFFKPRRVGQHIVLRPTWEKVPLEPGDVEIVLDPGQAFGTGDHPTTRMSLELLEGAGIAGSVVADIGCGSGILSIAACKLGAKRVSAIDVDPISVEVTRQNALLNCVNLVSAVGEGILCDALGSHPRFDVVVSNIISAILIRLARDAHTSLVPGGRWIVSGIITQNWPAVLEAAERSGFVLQRKLDEDGWVAATFSNRSA